MLEDKAAVFLSRSRGSMVTIDLRLGGGIVGGMPVEDVSEPITQHFLNHCRHRVRRLNVEITFYTQKHFIECLSSTTAVLQELQVYCDGDEEPEQITALIDILALSMPALQDVILARMPLPSRYESRFIGFASCRDLVLFPLVASHFSCESFCTLLKCCPELRRLHIKSKEDILDTAVYEGELVCAAKLESYDLAVPATLLGAFRVLRAPRLVNLHLCVIFTGWGATAAADAIEQCVIALQGFLRASSPPLRSFCVAGDIARHHLDSLLMLMPVLQRLEVADSIRDRKTGRYSDLEEMFTRLGSPAGRAICPHLEDVEVGLPAHHTLLHALWKLARDRRVNNGATLPIRQIRFSDTYFGAKEREVPSELHIKLAGEVDGLIIDPWRFDQSAAAWVRWRDGLS